MSVGVGVTSYNRPEVYALAMEFLTTYRDEVDQIVVVDDGTEPPLPTYPQTTHVRHTANRGIAAAKNTCLSHLAAHDLIILLDDDVFPVHAGWVATIRTVMEQAQIDVLGFLPRAHAQAMEATPSATRTCRSITAQSYMHLTPGAMLAITKSGLSAIGGMGYYPGPFGFEHMGWLIRAHRSQLCGAFPDAFVTSHDLDPYLWSVDMQGFPPGREIADWRSALTEPEKQASIHANQVSYIAEKTGRLYKRLLRLPDETEL